MFMYKALLAVAVLASYEMDWARPLRLNHQAWSLWPRRRTSQAAAVDEEYKVIASFRCGIKRNK